VPPSVPDAFEVDPPSEHVERRSAARVVRRTAIFAVAIAGAALAYVVLSPKPTAVAEVKAPAASSVARLAPYGPTLPPRAEGARGGAELARLAASVGLAEREELLVGEVLSGNVPSFLRTFVPVNVTAPGHRGTVDVAPDYLSVGSDDDFVRIPLTPAAAQKVADACGCVLPTPRLVDAIWRQAVVKLAPAHMPLELDGASSHDFIGHQRIVEEARVAAGHQAGQLLAGHKKDVVVTGRLASASDRVAIYGMHEQSGRPLQVLSLVHLAEYLDYSHGIRLVGGTMRVDGAERPVAAVLADAELAPLLSDEGPTGLPRYPEPPSRR
jgi:hypothetical protein